VYSRALLEAGAQKASQLRLAPAFPVKDLANSTSDNPLPDPYATSQSTSPVKILSQRRMAISNLQQRCSPWPIGRIGG